jgi:hypothetical protein
VSAPNTKISAGHGEEATTVSPPPKVPSPLPATSTARPRLFPELLTGSPKAATSGCLSRNSTGSLSPLSNPRLSQKTRSSAVRREAARPWEDRRGHGPGGGGRDHNCVDLDVYDGGRTSGTSKRHIFHAGLETVSCMSRLGAMSTGCDSDVAGEFGNPIACGAGHSESRAQRDEDMVPAEVLGGDTSLLGTPSPLPLAHQTSSASAVGLWDSGDVSGFGWMQPMYGTSVCASSTCPIGDSQAH